MNLSTIDWVIVSLLLGTICFVAAWSRQYTRSVADFLAANRCGGRYLLTMAEGISGLGAISILAMFEQYYEAGFAGMWWGVMQSPILLVISLSGWIIYRYRQTRAMTMAQFFEIRYSRKFRIFCGILAYVSGVLNYAIFPAVTARFFIYFCGIPQYLVNFGPIELNITLGIVMFFFLSLAVILTICSGQIAIMITDFLQGQFVSIVFLIIACFLFYVFSWSDIVETLKQCPKGMSKINPFDQRDVPDFNFWFFAILGVKLFYSFMAWQGSQGYYCSAKSPHEARMGRILASFRGGVMYLTITLLPICAYVFLRSNLFTEQAIVAQSTIDAISDTQIQKQMLTPIVLVNLLPPGIFGLFVAAMVAATVATDDTYLHSWGSIFIQDVVLPLRSKKLTEKQHLRLLRFSICGVAIFAWFFSMLFPLKEYIFMFFEITGAIYIGGAGAVIIGGLYWKRATTAGAWAGMITGSTLAISGIFLANVFWPYILPKIVVLFPNVNWISALPRDFPFNGVLMMFFASIGAIISYVVVSLLTKPDPSFDMDRMLHRVKDQDIASNEDEPARGFRAIFNFSKEFTKGDKFIFFATIIYTLFWVVIFVIGTVYALLFETTDDVWANWWLIQIVISMVIGVVSVIWFLWGGFRDLFELIRTLKTAKQNAFDDGTVVNHHNADE